MAQGKVKWFNADNSDESRPKFLLSWFGNKTGQAAAAASDAADSEVATPPASRVDPAIIGDVVGANGDSATIQPYSIQPPRQTGL